MLFNNANAYEYECASALVSIIFGVLTGTNITEKFPLGNLGHSGFFDIEIDIIIEYCTFYYFANRIFQR